MIRLRQVALVARDLDHVVGALCDTFGLEVCFNDPGVGEFGLINALMVVGDQFIEVVSPDRPGTTAERLIERRGSDCGYMVLYEVDRLDERIAHAEALGVRVIWRGDFDDIRGRHLHPRDIGGAIVSLDEATPRGSWRWGGPSWTAHDHTSVITGLAGITLAADDPSALSQRWAEVGVAHALRCTKADRQGEGLIGVDVVAADRTRVGEQHVIGGVTWNFV
jgi:hypothetical protein